MKNDWMSCDGTGSVGVRTPSVTRRGLLLAAGIGAVSWLSKNSALAQVSLNPSRESDQILVVIFLRGGADGLNIVVPYAEDAYYRLRPSLGIPAPKNLQAGPKDRAADLDGFFGIHPALTPLLDLYNRGDLAFVHACGSFDQTHSHFDAMSTMERGLATGAGTISDGWLARYLFAGPTEDSPLRAVAFGDVLPDSLRGATGAVAIESLADFRIGPAENNASLFERDLGGLYSRGKDPVSAAGSQTLKAIRALSDLTGQSASTGRNRLYPDSDLGDGLRQVAILAKSGVGLEVACLDKGGWDTHVAQGNSTGWQASLMDDLAQSLVAFAQDLGPSLRNVTVVAMTEFGRRAYENSGLGTDHGSASLMLVMGGGAKGGKVYADWPGLEDNRLSGPGDLKVTTDYRNVLAEVLTRKMGVKDIKAVFPGLNFQAKGIID